MATVAISNARTVDEQTVGHPAATLTMAMAMTRSASK